MSIDTHLAGSPSSVDEAALWMEKLDRALDDASEDVRVARSRGAWAWSGATAEAYHDLAGDLGKATDEIQGRAGDAAEKFRAYAQQLRYRQDDMAGHREAAVAGGLVVDGTTIQAPPPAAAVPALHPGATAQETAAWEDATAARERAVTKIELYESLVGDVAHTFDRIDQWVLDNLIPQEQESVLPSLANGMAAAIIKPDNLLGGATDFGSNTFAARAAELMARAEAHVVSLAARRSGNPAVRAGTQSPSQTALDRARARSTNYGKWLDAAADSRIWGRVLKFAGPIVAVGTGLWQISNGESPSTVGVEIAAGAAGAALAVAGVGAAAVALGVTAPVWATAAAVVVVGGAAAWAAGQAYEHLVPQDVREAIDEGISDAWNATTDAVGDAADAVGDAVSGAWNSVFG